jgi:N-acetyl-D-muramate 6-phosphate phosphatase
MGDPAHRLNISAVLFDLDGTLADTAGDLAAALNRLRADRGLRPLLLETLRAHASDGARGMLGAGLGIAKDHGDYERLRDLFLTNYEQSLSVHTRLFDGADAVLAEIERRGLRWGIVTNKIARFTTPIVAALGLTSRAGVVISGDSTPESKPHPAPLLEAAALLGVPARSCVYVGDAERDVIAGRAAGMKTLIARYGYLDADDVASWQADGEIHSLPDLLDWLPDKHL